MANELTPVELFGYNRDGDQTEYTISSSAVINQFSIMGLSDPYTIALATTAKMVIAGVSARDKTADGSSKLSVYTRGKFTARASNAIIAGSPVLSASDTNYPNTIMSGAGSPMASGAQVIGYALETFADGQSKQFMLRLS